MNVKELKEIIKNLPDDMQVIVQRDAEGNGYEIAQGADPECVYKESESEIYNLAWTADDACMEEDEWKEICSKPRCLVVYP